MTIDPDKLPTAAVEAAQAAPYIDYGEPDDRGAIAAFLETMLADDKAMYRAAVALNHAPKHLSPHDQMRAALTAAMQEL